MMRSCCRPRLKVRDFFFFLRTSSVGGGSGGGRCAARLFVLFFFPCSADHERDWPSCKVVFWGVGNQYAECEKKKNNSCMAEGYPGHKFERADLSSGSDFPPGVFAGSTSHLNTRIILGLARETKI